MEARVREAMGRRRAAEQADRDRQAVRDQLKQNNKTQLTELHRRRIWIRHGQEGRAWLKEIGQEPDFSLQLDKRGRPVKEKADA